MWLLTEISYELCMHVFAYKFRFHSSQLTYYYVYKIHRYKWYVQNCSSGKCGWLCELFFYWMENLQVAVLCKYKQENQDKSRAGHVELLLYLLVECEMADLETKWS